jgi:hypothetical protein
MQAIQAQEVRSARLWLTAIRRDPEFDLQLATCRPLEMAQRFFGEATSKSRFDAYLAKFTGFADESPLGIW